MLIVPPFCLFMYLAGRGGQQFFTCCTAGYIAFIRSHVTTNQPITFSVHPSYITMWFVSGEQINYLPMPKAETNNRYGSTDKLDIFRSLIYLFICGRDEVQQICTITISENLTSHV